MKGYERIENCAYGSSLREIEENATKALKLYIETLKWAAEVLVDSINANMKKNNNMRRRKGVPMIRTQAYRKAKRNRKKVQ